MMNKAPSDYRLEDVKVSDIDLGTRTRKDLGEVDQLSADIDQHGLHHPILVLDKSFLEEEVEQSDPEKPYLLIAGERRFTAVSQLGWDIIPAKISERPLDEFEIRTIELYENLLRKQMTPVEEAKAKAQIHELHQEKFGVAMRGAGKSGHTVRDTAAMLGESVGTIAGHLKLAKWADAIPELAEAKSKTEAFKIIDQKKKELAREELLRREKAKAAASGKTQQRANRKANLMRRYVLGDFFEEIKKVNDRTIDLFELDPDWGILFKERVEKRGSLTAAEYNTLAPDEYLDTFNRILDEAFRVMKDNSWLIVFYSLEDWHKETVDAIEAAGFKVQKMPAFWIHTSNRTATPAYRLGQRVEAILYARKGDIRIADMGHPNTFTHRSLHNNERQHPAEKPIELYEDIYKTFLGKDKIGASVISAFAGSGNAILAADNLEHNALGFDNSEGYKQNYELRVTDGTVGHFKSYKL